MDIYRKHVNKSFEQSLSTTQQLQAWTVANQQEFWMDLYDYIGLIPPLPKHVTRAYDESLPISSIPPFFEGLLLNYAENVLANAEKFPGGIALIGLREGQGLEGEKVTWRLLKERVREVKSALRARGLKKGEVVAALVSTSVDAVVLFLASATLGAVFTSINPDLGVEVRASIQFP